MQLHALLYYNFDTSSFNKLKKKYLSIECYLKKLGEGVTALRIGLCADFFHRHSIDN